MASISPPPADSVSPKGDDEVVSKKTFPGRGEIPEIIGVTSQDDFSATGHAGKKAPMGTGDGARVPFGPQPDTIPEIYMAPGSSERHSLQGGNVPAPPVTSVQREAPDNLLEALRGASIVDEHRVPCFLLPSALDAQLGTPNPRSAGFDTDSGPRIRRRKRLIGLKAPKRITPCGMLIAIQNDLAGPSLRPLRKY